MAPQWSAAMAVVPQWSAAAQRWLATVRAAQRWSETSGRVRAWAVAPAKAARVVEAPAVEAPAGVVDRAAAVVRAADPVVQGNRAEAPVGPAVAGAGVHLLQRYPLVAAMAAGGLVPHRRLRPATPGRGPSGSSQPQSPDRPRHRVRRCLPRSAPAGGQPTAPRWPRATAHGLACQPAPPRCGRDDRPARRRPDRIVRGGCSGQCRPRNRGLRPAWFRRIGATEAAASSCARAAAAACGSPARPPA